MKTTTASSDPKSFAKLQDLAHDIDVAMVTTVTVDGALRSRPMATRKFDDDGTLWFFTSDDSGKAHDVEEEQAVNVSYAEPKDSRYVSVTGHASVIHDREMAQQLWSSAVKPYFPRGLDDPHLALLRVRVESAEYWDARTSRMVRLFGNIGHHKPESGEHVKVDIRAGRKSG